MVVGGEERSIIAWWHAQLYCMHPHAYELRRGGGAERDKPTRFVSAVCCVHKIHLQCVRNSNATQNGRTVQCT